MLGLSNPKNLIILVVYQHYLIAHSLIEEVDVIYAPANDLRKYAVFLVFVFPNKWVAYKYFWMVLQSLWKEG